MPENLWAAPCEGLAASSISSASSVSCWGGRQAPGSTRACAAGTAPEVESQPPACGTAAGISPLLHQMLQLSSWRVC